MASLNDTSGCEIIAKVSTVALLWLLLLHLRRERDFDFGQHQARACRSPAKGRNDASEDLELSKAVLPLSLPKSFHI